MGRPKGRAKKGALASTETLRIRISKPLLQEIDKWQGGKGRSAYVKKAVAHYIRHVAWDYDKINKKAIDMI
jgi:metal-responsive CopG/Arc/MetJ family transcriptional regulator